jgi:hypothetical protein
MILIIAKEDSAYGVNQFIESMKFHGFDCLPLFIQPFESLVKHPSLKIFKSPVTFSDYLIDDNHFFQPLSNSELDQITEWINASVLNQRGSTGRNWNVDYNFKDILKYLNDCASFYDWVIKKYKPTAFVDFESDNVIRAVLDVVRARYEIKYYVFYSTRLDGGVAIGDGIISPHFSDLNSDDKDLQKAITYIKNYKANARLSPDEVIFDERNVHFKLSKLIYSIFSNIYFHLNLYLKKKKIKPVQYSNSLYSGGGFNYLFWKIKFLIRRYIDTNFIGSNVSRSYFKANYLYFALGQIVEGSEPNFSGGFLNDIDCLNILKSKIKSHKFRLLVKDHRSMLGDRSRSQREFIDSININYVWGKQLCSAEWMTSPQSLVFNAKAVFTLSGSVGLEALLSDVPVFIFGEPLYKKIMQQNGILFPRLDELDLFLSNPKKYLPNYDLLIISIAKIFHISRKYSIYRIKRAIPSINDQLNIDSAVQHLIFNIRSAKLV